VRIQKTGRFLLAAVLVQSERRDGKPRQKIVAYLGFVREEHAREKVWARKMFWDEARRRLDALGLGPAERQKVEAALGARVPRPTAEEVEEDNRAIARLLQSLRRDPS
jgi:hypothetical protein